MPNLVVTGFIKKEFSGTFAGAKDTGTGLDIPVYLLTSLSKVYINRTKDENIRVFIDGIEKAAFEPNDKVEISITEGTHTIQAKFKGLSTTVISFDTGKSASYSIFFCVDNSNFQRDVRLGIVATFVYFMFFLLVLINFFPHMESGKTFFFLMLPFLGISVYSIIKYQQNRILEITEG
jgi:hypothetical protein